MRQLLLTIALAILVASSIAGAARADCSFGGFEFNNQDNAGNVSDQCNDTGNGP